MKSFGVATLAAFLLVLGLSWGPGTVSGDTARDALIEPGPAEQQRPEEAPEEEPSRTPEEAIADGIRWLASVQGKDGGWGQDGGETS